MTYNKMSYISGVIIFFAAVILLTSILWLSGSRIISTKEYKIYFRFKDIVGLRDRAQVYMRGYRVGWSKDVIFEKEDVLVRVDVKKRFLIPKDSKIEINTLNFIGEKAITITPGVSQEYMKPGDVLQGENKDLMVVASNILNTLKKKLETGDLDKKALELAQTLSTIKELVFKLDKKVDQVDMALINRQIVELGSAAKGVRDMAVTAKADVHQVSLESSTSMAKVSEAAKNLSDLSVQLTQLTTSLNKGEGSMGELLKNKEYIQNLNSTVTELNLLIKDLQKNPGKYMNFSVF
jgi:phospholipid/cholesterol/gamma-HCH transport system substrate-binding protein